MPEYRVSYTTKRGGYNSFISLSKFEARMAYWWCKLLGLKPRFETLERGTRSNG